jgi:hypothetical protein
MDSCGSPGQSTRQWREEKQLISAQRVYGQSQGKVLHHMARHNEKLLLEGLRRKEFQRVKGMVVKRHEEKKALSPDRPRSPVTMSLQDFPFGNAFHITNTSRIGCRTNSSCGNKNSPCLTPYRPSSSPLNLYMFNDGTSANVINTPTNVQCCPNSPGIKTLYDGSFADSDSEGELPVVLPNNSTRDKDTTSYSTSTTNGNVCDISPSDRPSSSNAISRYFNRPNSSDTNRNNNGTATHVMNTHTNAAASYDAHTTMNYYSTFASPPNTPSRKSTKGRK